MANGTILLIKHDRSGKFQGYGNVIIYLTEPIGTYRYLIMYAHMAAFEDNIQILTYLYLFLYLWFLTKIVIIIKLYVAA